VTLHWDPADAVKAIHVLASGTWAREDLAKWLRKRFHERDPEAYAKFLLEDATRPDARPGDVEAAAAELKCVPPEKSVPALHALLRRADPDVRVAAALALHEIDPKDGAATAAVVAVAEDRSIPCGCRPDLTNRWCRIRALEAAVSWGAITRKELRARLADPRPDHAWFIESVLGTLENSEEAPTAEEVLAAWRHVLEGPPEHEIRTAIQQLLELHDVVSRKRMLAALNRLKAAAAVDPDDIQRLRVDVEALQKPDKAK